MPFAPPHIWVDADSCPAPVKEHILTKAKEYALSVTYVANRNIPFCIQDALFTMAVCSNTPGAADDYLIAHCAESDIAITRDIPLAKRLFEKKVIVLNDRGIIFSEQNLAHMLEERTLSLQMQSLGIAPPRAKRHFSKKELSAFQQSFNLSLNKRLKI